MGKQPAPKLANRQQLRQIVTDLGQLLDPVVQQAGRYQSENEQAKRAIIQHTSNVVELTAQLASQMKKKQSNPQVEQKLLGRIHDEELELLKAVQMCASHMQQYLKLWQQRLSFNESLSVLRRLSIKNNGAVTKSQKNMLAFQSFFKKAPQDSSDADPNSSSKQGDKEKTAMQQVRAKMRRLRIAGEKDKSEESKGKAIHKPMMNQPIERPVRSMKLRSHRKPKLNQVFKDEVEEEEMS